MHDEMASLIWALYKWKEGVAIHNETHFPWTLPLVSIFAKVFERMVQLPL